MAAENDIDLQANAQPAEQDAGGPTTSSASTSDDWRAAISDGKLRGYASQFKTPEDLAKTALNFRQQLSNAVPIPGRNASEQELRAFHWRTRRAARKMQQQAE